jgi:hypothetical protein
MDFLFGLSDSEEKCGFGDLKRTDVAELRKGGGLPSAIEQFFPCM